MLYNLKIFNNNIYHFMEDKNTFIYLKIFKYKYDELKNNLKF